MEIQPGPPVVFLLRFPEEAVGHLEFEVEAEKGAELQFDFQEHRGFTHERMCYRTGAGRRTFRLTRLNVMRYVKISVICIAPLFAAAFAFGRSAQALLSSAGNVAVPLFRS